MLSPRDDDYDDSHLCIKCNQTILGLENYVTHRKKLCSKLKHTQKDLTIDTLAPSYDLGADVFFQSLELQSSVKKPSLVRLTPPIPISKPSRKLLPTTTRDHPRMSPLETNLRGEDWIGGHSLRIGSNEDNQTKLINAVANISGSVKKDVPSSSYNVGSYDLKCEDESDESDESDEEDDEEIVGGGKWKPPPHHTGGKWRPASPDDWDEHTGGKWRLLMPDNFEDDDAPPPGHTKGKWIPGAHEKTQIMQTTIQTKGAVQYWCGPCNRRLGSRAIYERHLMSNLHMKKVLPEQELEFSGPLEPLKNVNKGLTGPSTCTNETVFTPKTRRKRKKTKEVKVKELKKVKKRNRKVCFVQCAGCKSRVRIHLMGKHLISHYHFRKAADVKNDVYKQLILDNIVAVVHQSPFQCSPCKFYTNWLSNFMQHWFSKEHEEILSGIKGRMWCSFCKFECDKSDDMLQHLSSDEHSEVVSVINRSMPIIIRKKSIIQCVTCHQEFRYNMEVYRHCQITGHQPPYTATNFHQEFHYCQICNSKFKSSQILATHLKTKHGQTPYMCTLCSRTFLNSEEAVKHRNSTDHRVRKKQMLQERGVHIKNLKKKCPHCVETVMLDNILRLKEHIREVHPTAKHSCSGCGATFILHQEVTRHVRSGACVPPVTSPRSSARWQCSRCLFATDSQSECFYHETLHTDPKKEYRLVNDKEKIILRYRCPLCVKHFPRASLRLHLRTHTWECPYVCHICHLNFTRKTSLNNHVRMEHKEKGRDKKEITRNEVEVGKKTGEKNFEKRDMSTADEQCPLEGCEFRAPSVRQLARHYIEHGGRLKRHSCSQCGFRSTQASHLRRHMLTHTGDQPYCCPHCPHTTASLENLRKHVLRSGRHTNLRLYHCEHCAYTTNMAAELRSHLTSVHLYDKRLAVDAVKTHLMRHLKWKSFDFKKEMI